MIEESLHKIQQRMADAMASVGRTDTALLVAVTKNHPVTAGEEGGPPGCACNNRGSGSPWMHSCRRKSRARGKRKTNALYRT